MKMFSKILIVNLFIVSLIFYLAGPAIIFAAGPAAVNLGLAGNFVILSKSGISTTGLTSIIGDIGVSPIDATAITGFGLTLPAGSAFSTSALVTGKVYAPGYADPTPANLTTAVSDMQTAYTDVAGRTNPTATELGAGNIGGLTLAPGLYKWSTGVTIPTDVTLLGSANDVWIFQIAQNLNVSSAAHIVLAGGAQASNIFWQVAGQTTIGTTAVFNGNILDQTAIVLNTGATLNGRALAQTAVTLDSNVVTIPTTHNDNGVGNNGGVTGDITPPTNTSISINAGASTTSSLTATLTLAATDATQMLISNDAGFTGASWESYATSKSWALTSGDGVKTVYAKFRDTALNMSAAVSDTINVSGSATVPVVSNPPAPTQGCSGGNVYNTSTGQLCVSNTITSIDAGCLPGNNFSITTGRNCNAATPNANAIASANANASFKRDLTIGTTGDDVKVLQVWLNTHGYAVASSGPGSSGNETAYFGGLTRAALAKFQAQAGIHPTAGYFGPITRAYLRANY